jgi:signal transduction histidine kinase
MVNALVRWFQILTNLGVDVRTDRELNRRIVFSNVVFLALPVVYLAFIAIDFDAYLVPLSQLLFDQITVPVVILACIGGLVMNGLGRTRISRVLFIVLWPAMLHIAPIILLETPTDYYLAYPFGIVFHGILIQLMISYRREPWLFGVLMVLNLAAISTMNYFLVRNDIESEIPAGLVDSQYLYDGILYWLLFNLVMFYVLFVVESFIDQVNQSHALIERQKEDLNQLNRRLEQLVHQRTAELEAQNEKLRQHAFYNAHMLRGPFCRILGLVQLSELLGAGHPEQQEIKAKLAVSLIELDERIREIQRLVEPDKISDSSPRTGSGL